ncbi:ActS/PrrB/RegB family redox-sensitive histidine kinase [Pseudokordiimonas caeni]|uniref:ActS/PrrB/RegB family redox-sensitive histidine kinase n=1 Tax=Pseudokordiimonas caeni TaxID=2997908 RepID=UPI002811BF90|nr:ActS/PrrB/RegB family redox-sensitive histidine kinase [Pseudokordiimonas caeni]
MPAADNSSDGLIAPLSTGGSVRLGSLVQIRWMAVVGQFASILVVNFWLGFDLPLLATLLLIGLSAFVNVAVGVGRDANTRISDGEAALQLGFDLVVLALLLFLTGGLANPFSVLLLAPTSVSASVLRARSTVALLALALAAVTGLAFTPYPLPFGVNGYTLDPLHLAGAWVALSFAMIFLAAYTGHLARESRSRADALAASHIALEREQRLSALGTLAAAAAHELGTPLGTIYLTAHDLKDTCPEDNPALADIELIISETARCREILAELGASRQGTVDHFAQQSLEAILREAAAPHEHRGIHIRFEPVGEVPQMARSAEAIHAFRNIIENATGYATSEVTIRFGSDGGQTLVTIGDDGPGFDPAIVRDLGEPYVTTREIEAGRDGGMGLGLFIARTLLERTGARVSFGTSPEGGAEIGIIWTAPPKTPGEGDTR